jgi:1-acyl-sn-glycerol-3-phosphate acyltransferase
VIREREGDGVDEARVIPLHGEPADPSGGRPGNRRSTRRTGRPTPGPSVDPASGGASIHALMTAAPGDAEPDSADPVSADEIGSPHWERRLAAALTFLRRRLDGDYSVDEYGFDVDLTEHVILPVFRPLYERWFRVEVNGVDNIPTTGAALLVANHAGGLWPVDAAMTSVAVRLEHPAGRYLRMLGADLLFATPGAGALARKTGSTLACTDDAERLLRSGELVGVWPEGFKGIGKPFRERYKLQRFGRGGFVQSALRTGAPIVPVSIIGSEEIHPVLGNVKPLARLLGLPYFPLTPTFPWLGPLGLLPLPSKWYIEFGEPIETVEFGGDAADDAVTVFDLTDRVRETIQSSLYRLLVQRRSVWR